MATLRRSTLAVVSFSAAAAIIAATQTSAVGAHRAPGAESVADTFSSLSAVSADSATDAWAVGVTGPGSLFEHWDGTGWASVASPTFDKYGEYVGLDALAPNDVWAVGDNYTRSSQTLIAHWDGSGWTHTPSANPGGRKLNDLYAVSADSATDAWAVGDYEVGGGSSATLAAHWDGSTWAQVPSPNPGGKSPSFLFGVDAVSPTDAWAVGEYGAKGDEVRKALIEHWDGTSWTLVPTPKTGSNAHLFSVTATSATDAWAVGDYAGRQVSGTLILHWDGARWTQVKGAGGAVRDAELLGVSAASPSDVWGVGGFRVNKMNKTVIEHWDGTSWKRVPSPSPGGTFGSQLSGVAAVSSDTAFAVGDYYSSRNKDNALIEDWDGTSWTQQAVPWTQVSTGP